MGKQDSSSRKYCNSSRQPTLISLKSFPMAALRVSIVIPTYNRAALVGRAIESALRAASPGDEILVVDDGSTDGTEAALASFRDRIRFITAPHRGAGATRNRGIAEAGGDLIAFLDSDDEWT